MPIVAEPAIDVAIIAAAWSVGGRQGVARALMATGGQPAVRSPARGWFIPGAPAPIPSTGAGIFRAIGLTRRDEERCIGRTAVILEPAR